MWLAWLSPEETHLDKNFLVLFVRNLSQGVLALPCLPGEQIRTKHDRGRRDNTEGPEPGSPGAEGSITLQGLLIKSKCFQLEHAMVGFLSQEQWS